MPNTVLIVDEVATNRIVMRVKLSSTFCDTLQAKSGAEALTLLAAAQPNLVIVSDQLPDMTGVDLCQKINSLYGPSTIPIIMTSVDGTAATRLAALRAGAHEVLERPLDETLLLARIRCMIRSRISHDEQRLHEGSSQAMGMSEPAPAFQSAARIAIISTRPDQAAPIEALLTRRSQHRISSHDVSAALRDLSTHNGADLAVLLLEKGYADAGLNLISSLRAQPETRHMALMVLHPAADRVIAADALDLGANDLMMGRIEPTELMLRLNRLLHQKARADKLRNNVHDGLRAAVIDPLTGLYNRRFALPRLASLTKTAADQDAKLAVMIADIDHFKAINDTHGHAVGDAVLRVVAARLRQQLQPTDLLARIGGEEFLIVLNGPSCGRAQRAARQLCRAISDTPITVPECPSPLLVTVSIGLALGGRDRPGASAEVLMTQADRALYDSKMLGRNKVTVGRPAA